MKTWSPTAVTEMQTSLTPFTPSPPPTHQTCTKVVANIDTNLDVLSYEIWFVRTLQLVKFEKNSGYFCSCSRNMALFLCGLLFSIGWVYCCWIGYSIREYLDCQTCRVAECLLHWPAGRPQILFENDHLEQNIVFCAVYLWILNVQCPQWMWEHSATLTDVGWR